jgi:CO/xanthine dehydrogenase Mo-binding subunit
LPGADPVPVPGTPAASRIDGVEKVTGAAKYAVDVTVPGMVHARLLRATVPHARIVRIDTARAAALPGVVAVVTGDDVRDVNAYYGTYFRDKPLIALERVRYVGEPVVAVAAVDELTALDALDLVEVEYDELPWVTDAEEAIKPDAPLLHEAPEAQADFYFKGRANPVPGTNICHRYRYEHGDVDGALADADRVFDDEFTFPMVYHYAMEPHTAVAAFDERGLTVWSSTQAPFAVQKSLAQVFGLPPASVRVIVPYVGGGFGSKSSIKIEPLVVAIARKARRPVRLAFTVQESMLTCRRLSSRVRIRTGVRRDGTILAKSVEIVLNAGAYADSAPAVATKAANRSIGPYRIPNLRLEALAVYTNTVPGASFRSIGGPQAVFATESQMDVIAGSLGLDPLAFRLKNLARKGDRIRPDLRPLDVDLAPALERAWRAASAPGGEGRAADAGVTAAGLAVAASDPAAMALATAVVRLKGDGGALVFASSVEMGQGVRTVFATIVARELGIARERVHVVTPDTAATPYDWATGASRSTTVTGLAVLEAARDVRAKLAQMAAEGQGMTRDRVRVEDGVVTDGERRSSLADLFHAYFGIRDGEVIGVFQVTPRSFGGRLSQSPPFWETSVGSCTIAVDPDTGVIRIPRYVSVADVGHALDRQMCEGQDEGAAVQGIGHTLFEALAYEDGQPINATLLDYHVPTFDETPGEFVTELIESGDGPGPYGARGMGEGGILPAAPAIANALARGLGIRVRDLPLTPERVWRALAERRARET